MSSASHANNAKAEPERMHYIQGYVPVSYVAPHSSLERASTWIGMGVLLAGLAGVGTLLFGLGAATVNSQEHWATYVWIGSVITVVCLVAGTVLIIKGRSGFRAYNAETGRTQ